MKRIGNVDERAVRALPRSPPGEVVSARCRSRRGLDGSAEPPVVAVIRQIERVNRVLFPVRVAAEPPVVVVVRKVERVERLLFPVGVAAESTEVVVVRERKRVLPVETRHGGHVFGGGDVGLFRAAAEPSVVVVVLEVERVERLLFPVRVAAEPSEVVVVRERERVLQNETRHGGHVFGGGLRLLAAEPPDVRLLRHLPQRRRVAFNEPVVRKLEARVVVVAELVEPVIVQLTLESVDVDARGEHREVADELLLERFRVLDDEGFAVFVPGDDVGRGRVAHERVKLPATATERCFGG